MTDEPRSRFLLWREGDRPPKVTAEDPLAGMEIEVLETWTEESQEVRNLMQTDHGRRMVENAVRLRVFEALAEELKLRSKGAKTLDAQEQTRPGMLTPPIFPKTQKSRTPTRAASSRATTS